MDHDLVPNPGNSPGKDDSPDYNDHLTYSPLLHHVLDSLWRLFSLEHLPNSRSNAILRNQLNQLLQNLLANTQRPENCVTPLPRIYKHPKHQTYQSYPQIESPGPSPPSCPIRIPITATVLPNLAAFRLYSIISAPVTSTKRSTLYLQSTSTPHPPNPDSSCANYDLGGSKVALEIMSASLYSRKENLNPLRMPGLAP
jgi:hypothetical protein